MGDDCEAEQKRNEKLLMSSMKFMVFVISSKEHKSVFEFKATVASRPRDKKRLSAFVCRGKL